MHWLLTFIVVFLPQVRQLHRDTRRTLSKKTIIRRDFWLLAKNTALPSDRPLYCHVKSTKQVRNNRITIMAGLFPLHVSLANNWNTQLVSIYRANRACARLEARYRCFNGRRCESNEQSAHSFDATARNDRHIGPITFEQLQFGNSKRSHHRCRRLCLSNWIYCSQGDRSQFGSVGWVSIAPCSIWSIMSIWVCNVSVVYFSVIVPPKIDYVAPSTRVEVSKGASIKLECRATGNPPPKIFWTRKVRIWNERELCSFFFLHLPFVVWGLFRTEASKEAHFHYLAIQSKMCKFRSTFAATQHIWILNKQIFVFNLHTFICQLVAISP